MTVKPLRVPEKVHTLEDLLGAVQQTEGFKNIVAIVEDEEGVTTWTIFGTTAERMNWLLDRAKLRLHEGG